MHVRSNTIPLLEQLMHHMGTEETGSTSDLDGRGSLRNSARLAYSECARLTKISSEGMGRPRFEVEGVCSGEELPTALTPLCSSPHTLPGSVIGWRPLQP
jgi:hypothetical protein